MTFVSFSPTKQYAAFSTLTYPTVTPTSFTITTENTPYQLTTDEFLSGLLLVDADDAAQFLLPSPADLVAAIEGCSVGTSFLVVFRNAGDENLELVEGDGVSFVGSNGVAPDHLSLYLFNVTSVTPGSETYVGYVLSNLDFS